MESSCLPIQAMKRERAAPHPKVPEPIWHFSTQGLPAKYITVDSRELLPHVFTLSPKMEWLFSVALSVSEKSKPGYSPVRCSMLSGLSSLFTQRDSMLWLVKVKKNLCSAIPIKWMQPVYK